MISRFQEQNGDHIVGLHMKLALEELFYIYQVNLYMSGHLHRFLKFIVEGFEAFWPCRHFKFVMAKFSIYLNVARSTYCQLFTFVNFHVRA